MGAGFAELADSGAAGAQVVSSGGDRVELATSLEHLGTEGVDPLREERLLLAHRRQLGHQRIDARRDRTVEIGAAAALGLNDLSFRDVGFGGGERPFYLVEAHGEGRLVVASGASQDQGVLVSSDARGVGGDPIGRRRGVLALFGRRDLVVGDGRPVAARGAGVIR